MELQLRITKIKEETNDTKTFFLEPIDKSEIKYKSGQFLTLLIKHHKKEVRRSYSLGSTPFVDEQLFITVKRKINGEISRHLLDHYKEGATIVSLAPSGRFTLYELGSTYFFIAAGSGITPVFSLIKDLLHHHNATKIILINQCRNEDQVIYKKELKSLEKKFKERFEIIQFYSRPKSHRYPALHLNNELLEDIIKEKLQTTDFKLQTINCYLCGPLAFMRMAEFTLKLLGFSSEQIRKEHFVIDPPPHTPLLSDVSPKKIIIHRQQKKYEVKVSYPTSILDAALQQGIDLPYSCKGGRCSTCSAYCISGKIVMSMNEVLTERDLEKGIVLTCVGFAVTDAEINFNM